MWNLFSTVEPKVIQPAKSLKEELLMQEEKALTKIQQEVTQMLTSINSVLKTDQTKSSDSSNVQTELIEQLESIVNCLQTQITTDNRRFEEYNTFRDQQKVNQQEFFKTTLRAYEAKKSELNKYIEELQDKVQTLEMKGFKTYELDPKPNNVLTGMNHSYLEKYMAKLQEVKKIEEGLHVFAVKKRNKFLKQKPTHSSTELTLSHENKENKENQLSKAGWIGVSSKISSLSELQKELELILLKEEMMEEILDKKIKKCKKDFQKLASQENSLKDSVKKMGMVNEEKRRSSNNLASSKGFTQLNSELQSKVQLKKTSSFFSNKPELNHPLARTPSIDEKRTLTRQNQREKRELGHDELQIWQENGKEDGNFQQKEKDPTEEDEQIVSKNFIEACESLITERFVGEEEEGDGELEQELNEEEEE